MLQKIVYVVCAIITLSLVSEAIPFSTSNESSLFYTLNSRVTALENLFFRADLQSMQAEIDELKEFNHESAKLQQERASQIQLIKLELENQKRILDGLFNETPKSQNCSTATTSGIYDIFVPSMGNEPFRVVCDADTQGGGWTVILRRLDGSENFYRNWNAYKYGFGKLSGEFFMGLDRIHAFTAEIQHELIVILEDFEGVEKFELYNDFAIGNERTNYKLQTLGVAHGTAGDSLSRHRGFEFSTYDRDHDAQSKDNCAVDCMGAWWYFSCHTSNLAGKYNESTYGKGVIWNDFRGYDYSLKRAVMMIRPKNQ